MLIDECICMRSWFARVISSSFSFDLSVQNFICRVGYPWLSTLSPKLYKCRWLRIINCHQPSNKRKTQNWQITNFSLFWITIEVLYFYANRFEYKLETNQYYQQKNLIAFSSKNPCKFLISTNSFSVVCMCVLQAVVGNDHYLIASCIWESAYTITI